MNSIKILLFTLTFFISNGLEFSALYAMEVEKKEMTTEPTVIMEPEQETSEEEFFDLPFSDNWKEYIEELLAEPECPNQELLDQGIGFAQDALANDNATIDQLAEELDEVLRKLCGDTETNRIKEEFKKKLGALIPEQTQPKKDIEQIEEPVEEPEIKSEQEEQEEQEIASTKKYEQITTEKRPDEANEPLINEWNKCLEELQKENDPEKFSAAIQKAHELAKRMGIDDNELKKQFNAAVQARALKLDKEIETKLIDAFNKDVSQKTSAQPSPERQELIGKSSTLAITEKIIQPKVSEKITESIEKQEEGQLLAQEKIETFQPAQEKQQQIRTKPIKPITAESIKDQLKRLTPLQEKERREKLTRLQKNEELLQKNEELRKETFKTALAKKLKSEKEAEAKKGILSRLLGFEAEASKVELPEKSKLFKIFENTLKQVGNDWRRGPSAGWQSTIAKYAFFLLNNNEITKEDTLSMIYKAIDDYDKTCWLHDPQKIITAKSTILVEITSWIENFKNFVDDFKIIMAKNITTTEKKLTLKKIVERADTLIKNKKITPQELRIFLQEAAKIKSAQELEIITEIQKKLSQKKSVKSTSE